MIAEALKSLRPGAEWSLVSDYASLVWHDKVQTKPTEQEVNAEIARLEAVPKPPTLEERLATLEAGQSALIKKGSLTEVEIEAEKT